MKIASARHVCRRRVKAVFTLVVVVVFLTGVSTVFFDVAHLSYVPHLVGTDRLVAANSTLTGLNQAADVSGRGIGGLVVQLVGPAAAIVADALGFLWSAWCIARIRAAG